MVRIVLLVGLVGLLMCGSAWAAANRVLVMDSIETIEKLRDEVGEAIKEALIEGQLTEVAFVTQAEQGCGTLDCQIALARQKKFDYLLLVRGMASGTGYQLSLELWDVTSNRMLGSDSKECELCDPKDFPKAARDRTRLVLSRVQQEIAAPKTLETAKPKLVPEKQADAMATDPTSLPAWVERGFWDQPLPIFGLGLAAVGAGTLSYGIYMLAIDGDDACAAGEKSPCPNKHNTKTLGWVSTGAGAAAVIVGSALAIWGQDSTRNVHVAVSPNSLGLWGRF